MTRSWQLFSIAIIVATAGWFFSASLAGHLRSWPVPLDDSYIYFAYARSLALGDGMSWTSGGGYSSGATSLLYPVLLAPGYALVHALGTPHWMGAVAAVFAVAALYASSLALHDIVPQARWLAPMVLLCCPLLDWSLFSGMETALLCAVIAHALRSVDRATRRPAHQRRGAQRSAGLWIGALLMCRPETLPLAFCLAIATVMHAGRLSTGRSLLRTLGPATAWILFMAAINLWLTGEIAAAGAIRKLVWYDPFIDHQIAVSRVLINLVVLIHQGILRALGGPLGCALVFGFALSATVVSRRRHLAAPLLLGAVGALVLVAQNETARYQNFRYIAPSLIMVLYAALLGMAPRRRFRRTAPSVLRLSAALRAIALPFVGEGKSQATHFGKASTNIADQHGEIARWLRSMNPLPRRVLVGDAGAIPFLGGIAAIDGLGLGGYRALPFARASRHGPAAVVELIERLPPKTRPDVMALYPSWWRGLADAFGSPVHRVRIEENVICASDEKIIYRADWRTLAPPPFPSPTGSVNEVDVADLVSERIRHYQRPLNRGWLIADKRLEPGTTTLRFDAGRIIAAGSSESFIVSDHFPGGSARLRLRTDRGGGSVHIEVERTGVVTESQKLVIPPPRPHHWSEPVVELSDVQPGDRIRIGAVDGDWRSHHLWLSPRQERQKERRK